MNNRTYLRRRRGLGRRHAQAQLVKGGYTLLSAPRDRYSFFTHLNTVFNLNRLGWVLFVLSLLVILTITFSAGFLMGSLSGGR